MRWTALCCLVHLGESAVHFWAPLSRAVRRAMLFRDARAADFLGVTSDMPLEFVGRARCGMSVP